MLSELIRKWNIQKKAGSVRNSGGLAIRINGNKAAVGVCVCELHIWEMLSSHCGTKDKSQSNNTDW